MREVKSVFVLDGLPKARRAVGGWGICLGLRCLGGQPDSQDVAFLDRLIRPILDFKDDRSALERAERMPCPCGNVEGTYGTGW